MNYREAIRYLESLVNYENMAAWPYRDCLKLERFEAFLGLIGNPEKGLKVIHIAGTKGKGSTSAFCAYILRQSGYRTGLYTSPHLHDFRERIRILKPGFHPGPNGDFEGMISCSEVARITSRLKPTVDRLNSVSVYGPLTFFEVYTGVALTYFSEQKVDLAVLETGMGGRLDATNVAAPVVCAITPISYEHTQKLGKTLKRIAGEKAGIIKPSLGRMVVISSPQVPEVRKVLRQRCRETGAQLREVGRQILIRPRKNTFEVKGICGVYRGLRMPLVGDHQMANAACAIGVMEILNSLGYKISAADLKKGIRSVRWPGRCELVGKSPRIVLDGAQNVASAMVLKTCLQEKFRYRRLIMVLGISNDKDIAGICRVLKSLADKVILTKANSSRATDPYVLAEHFSREKTCITSGVKEATRLALRLSGSGDLILVCGSLFVVGEYRDEILNE